ncbi:indole-3-glycerol phosphate synthase, chloroplastic-like isoform X2 [Camellia sinensis]|uniref:indole-3-glycerol phosphate synthase, chloroplastic-like isoform X1 n=1 Tax=Camellia sinensis TaxID=4442 RepID=UPI0010364927|nr:indole-3-glycerol phosphate synthase, chloroplastic-like isoform X1 [Camellia sinensis]XP_028121710.1 indole-3-glycerol phosphate synthase, chloroplastic-like isoform X2 [Camellia sinensis]
MEGIVSLRPSTPRVSFHFPKFPSSRCSIPSILRSPMADQRICIRAQQSDSKDVSSTLSPFNESEENALKIKEWEVGRFQDEIAASQGIRIRRRPPTGPPLHYVGPFEFRIENEGNTPRNILEEIVWNKDVEVSHMKEKKPLFSLKKALDNAPPARDFVGALRASNLRTGLPGLIAEVKKASPSRGVLRENFDPVEIAQAYEKGGAACLSVLTDQKYFQGSFENLEAIRNAGVKCPLLCKEFIIDAWQIYYARTKGADAILLIAAILPDLDIKYMTKICKMLGLAALVEVHNEQEMDRILGIDGVELIGINNRDLETFKVDISNTKKLLEGKRGQMICEKDIVIVGESGLFTPADIAYVQESGVKAVLVGESIVKKSDPAKGITELFGKDISCNFQ